MDQDDKYLFFSTNNAKLRGTRTATFSLPAGITCPGAVRCKAWWDREQSKLRDGPKAEFRCFFASQEAAFPNLRDATSKNLERLKRCRSSDEMAELIYTSLPGNRWRNIRIHVGGDFFSVNYFRAWLKVVERVADRNFYAYTTHVKHWVDHLDRIPDNLTLTASRGGRWDHLIDEHSLRSALVVFHPDEAEALGLEIDHDDSHAREKGGDFALLIHGTGPPGSRHNAAIKRLKAEGVSFSYGRGPRSLQSTAAG